MTNDSTVFSLLLSVGALVERDSEIRRRKSLLLIKLPAAAGKTHSNVYLVRDRKVSDD